MTAAVWTKVRELIEEAASLPQEERIAYVVTNAPAKEICDEALQILQFEEKADEIFAVESQVWRFDDITPEPDRVGEIVGNYRLEKLIGRGGMGAVYRAMRIDASFEKCVAVKLIDAAFYSNDLVAHFRVERQILANLEHPNIARLLDGGARADGMPYLIMEYVEGVSPYDYCRVHNFSVTQRLLLFQQICSAVHFAHQRMVIHRDLKPANILVTAEGTPKLLDFGIAKVLTLDSSLRPQDLTSPAMHKMTVRYASPEQVRSEPVTTASDVYSLGVILYELLAGQSPYGKEDRPTHQMMAAVCDQSPARPSVWVKKLKGDLDNIALRALRKSPAERYASVDQFSEDIRRYLDGLPVVARGDAPLYVAARFIHRNRVLVAGAVLLFCALVGGLIEVSLARARAERRFNEVQQLAHSVMFDYADAIDRLPGATPVRARLVKDALTYLDNLSKKADTPRLQKEIVDAYAHVSDVQGNEYENNLGDPKAALASAHKAVDAAEKLLREAQSTPALSSAANAFSTYGSLLYATGDLKAADAAYQRALSLYWKVAAASPQDLDNKASLITCLRHLGDLYGGYGFANLGKTSEGLAYYEQGKTLALALVVQFPSNVAMTKESYKMLLSVTSAEAAMGKRDEAAKDLEEALTQIQRVSIAEPDDTNVKYELAVGESRLGQMLLDDRDAAGAVPHLAQSSGLLQKMLNADPGNANYRRGQSTVESQWAAALRGSGKIQAAVEHNERALELAQALSHDAPASTQYRSDVGSNERKLSEGLVAAGKADAALQHAQQAERILCQNGSDPTGQTACGRALVAVGNAYRALHEAQLAVPVFRRAVEIASARSEADPSNTIFGSDSARAQAALAGALAETGDDKDARSMYSGALKTWSSLRQAKTISAEDAFRSDATARALAALPAHR